MDIISLRLIAINKNPLHIDAFTSICSGFIIGIVSIISNLLYLFLMLLS